MRSLQASSRSEEELRYVVKIDIHMALNTLDLDFPEPDTDHLDDLDEIIEQLDDLSDDAISEDVRQRLRFDLCPECRKKFLANPLGRKKLEKFNFSQNSPRPGPSRAQAHGFVAAIVLQQFARRSDDSMNVDGATGVSTRPRQSCQKPPPDRPRGHDPRRRRNRGAAIMARLLARRAPAGTGPRRTLPCPPRRRWRHALDAGPQAAGLMGVDTPETVKEDTPVQPWGPEATQFTREFVGDGNSDVRLQFDRERTDRFGRYLAYVWVGDRMLNEELLRRARPLGAGLPLFAKHEESLPPRTARSAAGEARDLERTGRRTSPVAEFRKRGAERAVCCRRHSIAKRNQILHDDNAPDELEHSDISHPSRIIRIANMLRDQKSSSRGKKTRINNRRRPAKNQVSAEIAEKPRKA